MAKIEVKSEITGSVWKIVTKPSDSVTSGTALMILESMKMEIPVVVEDDGTITEILVTEGQAVVEGQVVAILEG
ncbi:MAG: biotin/lipoyl-binding protein [Rhodocyclaceae bacterium]|nr:MAG: biotin/lipoyl-binding protein [Rhodocyclaceae bacterium]